MFKFFPTLTVKPPRNQQREAESCQQPWEVESMPGSRHDGHLAREHHEVKRANFSSDADDQRINLHMSRSSVSASTIRRSRPSERNHIANDLPSGRTGRSFTMARITTELPADRSGRSVVTWPHHNRTTVLVVLMWQVVLSEWPVSPESTHSYRQSAQCGCRFLATNTLSPLPFGTSRWTATTDPSKDSTTHGHWHD
jgi:hypothetical protein